MVLDDGMRWRIECLFSDFKSRGFGIIKLHLKQAARIERLILILTLSLYWAVSTGMKPIVSAGTKEKQHRSLTFLFKQDLRFILNVSLSLKTIPILWNFKNYVG